MTVPNNIVAPMMDVEAVNVLLTPTNPTGQGPGQGSPFVDIVVNITAKSTGSTLNVGTPHSLQYSLNNGSTWTDITGWSSGSTVNTSLSLLLSAGTYSLWVRATDQLGVTSAIAKTTIVSNSLSVTWTPLGVAEGQQSNLVIRWGFPGYAVVFLGTKYPSGTTQGPTDLGNADSYGFFSTVTTAAWGGDTSENTSLYMYSFYPGGVANLIGTFNFYNTGIA